MGRKDITETVFECDFCGARRTADDIWHAFPTGSNTYTYHIAKFIFCSELCAQNWVGRHITSKLRKITKRELLELFPNRPSRFPYDGPIGNTD